ncbi:PIN domain-containing protein [Sphingomonas rubra]|uniref:PIN domain nuclease, a component of toxin-antitoxin system (PIN domain) n=1 Tax=Sphingomonas rubra TaxID=634430 RepID=A0A1I5R602_9SPHN|nr:PIN domain-containing protein [Sphingomonas rubra]SFP53933.1 PIN domain nuclease, a component of toxin-antitoxin system (PIN domain) [Sphingomonas rubra]
MVIDAAALLAVLLDEPGAEIVIPQLRRSVMSAVNVSESCSRGLEQGADISNILGAIASFEIDIASFDLTAARATAELRAPTRSSGISLGDRACLVLGRSRSLPILTGDRRMATAGEALGYDIRLIR